LNKNEPHTIERHTKKCENELTLEALGFVLEPDVLDGHVHHLTGYRLQRKLTRGKLYKSSTVPQNEMDEKKVIKLTSSIDVIGGFSEILMPLLALCSLIFFLGGAQGLSSAPSNFAEFTLSSCGLSVLDGVLMKADRSLA
jgi:hypothetical protein